MIKFPKMKLSIVGASIVVLVGCSVYANNEVSKASEARRLVEIKRNTK